MWADVKGKAVNSVLNPASFPSFSDISRFHLTSYCCGPPGFLPQFPAETSTGGLWASPPTLTAGALRAACLQAARPVRICPAWSPAARLRTYTVTLRDSWTDSDPQLYTGTWTHTSTLSVQHMFLTHWCKGYTKAAERLWTCALSVGLLF